MLITPSAIFVNFVYIFFSILGKYNLKPLPYGLYVVFSQGLYINVMNVDCDNGGGWLIKAKKKITD